MPDARNIKEKLKLLLCHSLIFQFVQVVRVFFTMRVSNALPVNDIKDKLFFLFFFPRSPLKMDMQMVRKAHQLGKQQPLILLTAKGWLSLAG